MRRAGPPAAPVVLGGLLTVLVTVPERLVPGLGTYRPLLIGLAWLAFAATVPLARRIPARVAVPVILAGAVAVPVAAAFGPPSGSDDVYRYVWDGRDQAVGINPYRYPPASAELVLLRDPGLWPAHETAWCVTADDPSGDERLVRGCTLINRSAVPTIYPPVAQAYFFVVHVLSPAGGLARPFQLAGVAVAIATTLLLLLAAQRRGADVRMVIAWAWCPAVALEAANNAHVDAVAVALAAAALVVLSRRHSAQPAGAESASKATATTAAGGALLGLAIATKVTPVLVLPALVRRRPLLVVSAAIGTVAAAYGPHLLAVGPDVIGYLPGYVQEEGYASGSRFGLLTLLVPERWAGVLAVVVLAAVAVAVARTRTARGSGERP